MKKNLRLKQFISILFYLLFVLILGFIQTKEVQAELKKEANIDAIVIRGSSLGQGPSGKTDGAVLITHPEEINQYKNLFFNNNRMMHACGYSYEVEFWAQNQLYKTVPYNIECGLEEFERNTEEIASLMKAHDQQFLAGTVQTIHYFEVPVTQDPSVFIQKMRQDGLHVFPFDGLNSRYPSIELNFIQKGKDTETFEKEAQAKSQSFMDHWPKNTSKPLGYTPLEYYGEGYSAGEAEITFKSTVWFELGVDLKAVAAAIETDNIQVKRANTPAFYHLALISPEENREKIKQQIKPYLVNDATK